MHAAVEISLYPLGEDYIPRILAFIERLNRHRDLRVVTNDLSTQIWGELHHVMRVLSEEFERAANDGPQLIFVMKVLPKLAAPAASAPT
jgi:uncharacterized protein YqgV (UPF0045/DUF77 family)